LAFYFYPDQSIGSLRPENWACWLSEKHEVEVITSFESSDEKFGERFRVRRTSNFFIRYLRRRNSFRQKSRLLLQSQTIMPSEVAFTGHKESGVLTYRMPCLYDFWVFPAIFGLFKSKPDVVIA